MALCIREIYAMHAFDVTLNRTFLTVFEIYIISVT